jgi:hypothetical protein
MAMVGTVVLNNVTNPDWGANFNVGDTLQVIISGAMPNQPVYVSDSVNGTSTMGTTDGNGNFTYVAVEQTSSIGSYTQVWTVGNITASPALSYIVGQLGSTGTVTTTDTGQTTDGNMDGYSTLSINNGVVSAYSETDLDYTSSLYYDSSTVATLFDEGSQVNQLVSGVSSGSTNLTMTANATAWHDYDLQTDHYAVAYLVSGGYYVNPLYWGDSCEEDSGDCSIDSAGDDAGDYDYEITADFIYMGSTLADQMYIPQDGSSPLPDVSVYGSFLAEVGATPSGPVIKVVADWGEAIALIGGIALTAESSLNPHRYLPGPAPIPYLLDLDGDAYEDPTATSRQLRVRTYVVRDTNGFHWYNNYPLTITERFSQISGSGDLPAAHNWINGRADDFDGKGRIADNYQISSWNNNEIWYWQRYWASGFYAPGLSVPAIAGYPPGVIPLMIKDFKSICRPGIFGTQGVDLDLNWVGINGDLGPGTACKVPK